MITGILYKYWWISVICYQFVVVGLEAPLTGKTF